MKPVPEDEWMEKRRTLEAESVTQESMAPPAEPAEPAEPQAPRGDSAEDRERRPRRRSRRAGTPTRLIGTGKTSKDDD